MFKSYSHQIQLAANVVRVLNSHALGAEIKLLKGLWIYFIYFPNWCGLTRTEHRPCYDSDQQIININFGPSAHRLMILISTDLQYFSRLRYVYLLQKGKQTQIDWKCKFIKFLFHSASSSGLYWILIIFLFAIMRTVQDPQEPPKSSVGQPLAVYTCSWCPRVCQPVFSQYDVWHWWPGCSSCAWSRVRTLRSCRLGPAQCGPGRPAQSRAVQLS